MKVVCENYNGTNDDNDKGNNVNDIACDDNGAVADGACDDDNGEGDGEGDRHDDHTNIKQASHQQELIIKQASHQQEQLIKETEQVTNQTLNEFIIQPKEVKKKKNPHCRNTKQIQKQKRIIQTSKQDSLDEHPSSRGDKRMQPLCNFNCIAPTQPIQPPARAYPSMSFLVYMRELR